ncbi:proline--tRNA ligase [Candidatus Clostridium stratigraminis]|uniref:Proline--tRNA ligase n=1 Tax=Candidatus Clostridium stratigraminis TaxID=3381661 RepID=A0ABW8T091_9CLOT
MYMSKMFIKTLREAPNEAEIASHKLMIRAGLARNLVSGVYSYLPLGIKVLDKIKAIIRDEINKKDAEEILCSALQPKELWEESGRWSDYGKEMFRLKDRNEREFCLGPTHEEIFTNIIKNEITSYKQLPINLYQIQTKYRDERRPRFGLLRTREFIMKDAYSFDKDELGLDKSYNDMYDAYSKIFNRCGLQWKAVLADTGTIGGTGSHQFMALSEVGESDILYCSECDYAADREKAEFMLDEANTIEQQNPYEKIHTPNHTTIEDLCNFIGEPAYKIAKSLVFRVNDKIILALIRGDRELNIVKLCNAIGVIEEAVEMASEIDIRTIGSEPGFIGPIGLKNVEILVDRELKNSTNFYTGANEKDYHFKNVNYGRDFTGKIVDLASASEGDKCPQCGKSMKMERGIEVGQVFKLGTKYSKPMECNYLDESGKKRPMVMGCYGIGVTRILASIIEQHHDENGIIWPVSVAPYHVVVVPVNVKDENQFIKAKEIYEMLKENGIGAILDDRDERAGVKFKDADLIGIPIRITVGKKIGEGIVEFKQRSENNIEEINVNSVLSNVKKVIVKA